VAFDFKQSDVYKKMIAVLRKHSTQVQGIYDVLMIDECRDLDVP